MTRKKIVIDANILIRAVLGVKVIKLIKDHYVNVNFYTPRVCYQDAEKYLPILFQRRNQPTDIALQILNQLNHFVEPVDEYLYSPYAVSAKARIESRDIDDWPIIACALMQNCPIWTEDNDFFGTGVANWTTDRVHLYLSDSEQ